VPALIEQTFVRVQIDETLLGHGSSPVVHVLAKDLHDGEHSLKTKAFDPPRNEELSLRLPEVRRHALL